MIGDDYDRFMDFMEKSNRITDLKSGDVLISRGRYNKKGTEIIFGKYADTTFNYFYNYEESCIHITWDFDKK